MLAGFAALAACGALGGRGGHESSAAAVAAAPQAEYTERSPHVASELTVVPAAGAGHGPASKLPTDPDAEAGTLHLKPGQELPPLVPGQFTRPVAEYRATPAQIALAWLLHRSAVMLPIPGTASVQHLEENVAAAQIELSADEVSEVGQLSAGDA